MRCRRIDRVDFEYENRDQRVIRVSNEVILQARLDSTNILENDQLDLDMYDSLIVNVFEG